MPSEQVLITGASGFVGRHLCEHLRRCGVNVVLSGRTPLGSQSWAEFRPWDLQQPIPNGLLAGIDVVFHLAGLAHAGSRSTPTRDFQVSNSEATRRLLDAAIRAGVRSFVFSSSSKADLAFPGADTSRDPYGASKRDAERALLDACDVIHVAIARPVLVYGPGVKGNLLQLMRLLDRGRMPPLPAVANRRSLVGVQDLCRVLETISSRDLGSGQVWTVTDGESYSTHRIVNALSLALGRGPVPESRLPMALYRGVAKVADGLERVLDRDLPLNSNALEKLFGSAEFSSDQTWDLLSLQPSQRLEDAAGTMARTYRITGG